MGDCRPLFLYFILFYKQLTLNNCSIKVFDNWIRTLILLYRKRPRCQLCHSNTYIQHNCYQLNTQTKINKKDAGNGAFLQTAFVRTKFNANLGWSPGLVVMVGDSCPEGRGFESQHHLLDGHFSHLFVVKNCNNVCLKRRK